MAESSHTMTFELQAADTDFTARWKISSILSHMQILADKHADMLRCGQRFVTENGLSWVIARVRIDMADYPHYGDTVLVTTWPGRPERLAFPRYFRFCRGDGGLLGTATSRYMMIDMRSRRFIRPQESDVYRFMDDFCPDVNPQPERVRIKTPAAPVCRTPRFSDIDFNRHMNNARYAEWVCDLFPAEYFERASLGTFQINYLSDGLEGREMRLETEKTDVGFIVRGTDTESGKTVFESAGKWR